LANQAPPEHELVRCNLCGASEATVLCRRARWGQRMTNVVCRQCGLVYANPRLAREALDRFYREWVYPEFLDSAGRFTGRLLDSSRVQAADTFRYFTQASGPMAGRRVLEIGCGLGDFLMLAREAGADVLGIEMDGLYAAVAEERGLPIGRTHIEATTFNRRFDIVAMFHVIEHLEDPKATLTSLLPHLAPQARLFIETPNVLGPWRITPHEFFRVEHLFNYSPHTLEATLAEAGYRVIARDVDPFILRVVAAAGLPGHHAPDLRSHHDAVLRHMFKWRVRSRVFQPYYALRRIVRPDGRRR
jgi:2-polyprenyl-3-methyl-5-hydroxy-6-metoxy-1,4-benzoquinol methylase